MGMYTNWHCFLRLSSAGSAGSIVVLVPGCCWAYSAFSCNTKNLQPLAADVVAAYEYTATQPV